MTIQELQLLKDDGFNSDMVKNEAEREARLAVRRQEALLSKQVDRAANAHMHEMQKPVPRTLARNAHATMMQAAGTGDVQNVLPAQDLLDWVNQGDKFLPPALAGHALSEEEGFR